MSDITEAEIEVVARAMCEASGFGYPPGGEMWTRFIEAARCFIGAHRVIETMRKPGPADAALQAIARTTFSGSEMSEEYMRGNRDAHATCARMARAAMVRPLMSWVLVHQYGDGSGRPRVERVYLDEVRARQDFALKEGNSEWELQEVPVVMDGATPHPETLVATPPFIDRPRS